MGFMNPDEMWTRCKAECAELRERLALADRKLEAMAKLAEALRELRDATRWAGFRNASSSARAAVAKANADIALEAYDTAIAGPAKGSE